MEPNRSFPTVHLDSVKFRSALAYTSQITGFNQRLIEKDYFCTLVLHHFAQVFQNDLIFKGGTSLSKVHADFYRLSEDLDFVIPTEINVSRSVRRAKVEPIRTVFDSIPQQNTCFRIAKEFEGQNNSKQYIGNLIYDSLVTGQSEPIIVEVGLREPALTPAMPKPAKTLLTCEENDLLIDDPTVTVFSLGETYAEKIRAALTRREPKIRDYYDIFHASSNNLIDLFSEELRTLVRKKLAVPGNDSLKISTDTLAILKAQVDTELRSVLRVSDHANFNLEKAFEIVEKIQSFLDDSPSNEGSLS